MTSQRIKFLRYLIPALAVVGIYLAPMIFTEMSHQYLAESALKSGFIVFVCDLCRKDHKDLTWIIAIEFFMSVLCAIIAVKWSPVIVGIDHVIADIYSVAFWAEIGILAYIGAKYVGAHYSITYDRRRDDICRSDFMECSA